MLRTEHRFFSLFRPEELVTSATLVVTSALLVVTKKLLVTNVSY